MAVQCAWRGFSKSSALNNRLIDCEESALDHISLCQQKGEVLQTLAAGMFNTCLTFPNAKKKYRFQRERKKRQREGRKKTHTKWKKVIICGISYFWGVCSFTGISKGHRRRKKVFQWWKNHGNLNILRFFLSLFYLKPQHIIYPCPAQSIPWKVKSAAVV